MKNKLAIILVLVTVSAILSGCGETMRGLGKDFHRVGRGVKTIFVSDYR